MGLLRTPMLEAWPVIVVLIPALITSPESVDLLRETISRLPDSPDLHVVVVSQGMRPHLGRFRTLRRVNLFHSKKPLTKWGAIARARGQLDLTVETVIIVDADAPFDQDSLRSFVTVARVRRTSLCIGERDRLVLYADDEFSKHSRSAFELISNSLLLDRLRYPLSPNEDAPDVQSGLYGLAASMLCAIRLDDIGPYGGELSLFWQCVSNGAPISTVPVVSTAQRASTYNLRVILASIGNLTCLHDLRESELRDSVASAMRRYPRRIQDIGINQFSSDAAAVIEQWLQERRDLRESAG